MNSSVNCPVVPHTSCVPFCYCRAVRQFWPIYKILSSLLSHFIISFTLSNGRVFTVILFNSFNSFIWNDIEKLNYLNLVYLTLSLDLSPWIYVYRRCKAIAYAPSQGYETFMEQPYQHIIYYVFAAINRVPETL